MAERIKHQIIKPGEDPFIVKLAKALGIEPEQLNGGLSALLDIVRNINVRANRIGLNEPKIQVRTRLVAVMSRHQGSPFDIQIVPRLILSDNENVLD